MEVFSFQIVMIFFLIDMFANILLIMLHLFFSLCLVLRANLESPGLIGMENRELSVLIHVPWVWRTQQSAGTVMHQNLTKSSDIIIKEFTEGVQKCMYLACIKVRHMHKMCPASVSTPYLKLRYIYLSPPQRECSVAFNLL